MMRTSSADCDARYTANETIRSRVALAGGELTGHQRFPQVLVNVVLKSAP
jgi:hypothetical protein